MIMDIIEERVKFWLLIADVIWNLIIASYFTFFSF